jgi:tRNA G18 (ribose-2'-O)-methylase SpoU
VQHLWLVSPPSMAVDAEKRAKRADKWEVDAAELQEHVAYARAAGKWLSLRFFETSEECIAALREAGREIWVTDLSQGALCLTSEPRELPHSLAVVIGTESTGASPAMLQAADKRRATASL